MHDLRLRMVLLGLVLGVVVAVVVAAQGCGEHKNPRHAGGGGGATPASAGAGGGGSAAGGVASAAGDVASAAVRSPARASAREHSRHAVRRSDPGGPFFSFRRGRMARADAPRQRAVALTFDDGPGPATTQILHELRSLHARATFFVVGTMAAIRPDVVRAEHRAGMQIGNHTWTHPAMPTLSAQAQLLQIRRTDELLRSLTGTRPRFFRPPNWRAGRRTARIVTRERLVGVLRTVDTRDWTLPGARTIVRRALRVRPGGIVAMHDAGGDTRQQTVAAVPLIVRGLRRRHLRLVTVGELYAGRR